jgi:hypothetical protein
MPTRDMRTRDKRLSRQLAIYAGARCEDTYIKGCDGSRAEGPLVEPQAASVARTITMGASRRVRFMVRSSASAVVDGNLGAGEAQRDQRKIMLRDEAAIQPRCRCVCVCVCSCVGSREGTSGLLKYTHHALAPSPSRRTNFAPMKKPAA